MIMIDIWYIRSLLVDSCYFIGLLLKEILEIVRKITKCSPFLFCKSRLHG